MKKTNNYVELYSERDKNTLIFLRNKFNLPDLQLHSSNVHIDLKNITEVNGKKYAKIQIFPYGSYNLGRLGCDKEGNYIPSVFDEKVADDMIEGFNTNVKQQRIPLDEDHKMANAFGWLLMPFKDKDGLDGIFELTPVGFQKINDKEYCYASMAYLPEYINPVTNKVYKNILVSHAVTNYPALTGIAENILIDAKSFNNKKEGFMANEEVKINNDDADKDEKKPSKEDKSKKKVIDGDAEGMAGKVCNKEVNMDIVNLTNKLNDVLKENILTSQMLSVANIEIQKLREESDKFRHESFCKSMEDKLKTLLPNNQGSFKLNKTGYEASLDYCKSKVHTQEGFDSYFKALEAIPETKVDLRVYGSTNNANDDVSATSKVNAFASKAVTDNDPKNWSTNFVAMMNKNR